MDNCKDGQRQRDGRVLEVAEVVEHDGVVLVEQLVLRGADDELHHDGRHHVGDYKYELKPQGGWRTPGTGTRLAQSASSAAVKN